MSPGILLQDKSLLEQLQQSNDTVLRARWDARDLDGKVHMPLSKRNSTPVGASLNTTTHAQVLQVQTKMQLTTVEVPNHHRRLDRSHSEPVAKGGEGRQANSSRYKTELCRPYEENGFCKYGEKCQFAHGQGELRNLARHPKYKTELCRTFHSIGICPYGPRCHFIHNPDEKLKSSSPPAVTHAPLVLKEINQMGSQLGLGSTPESPPSSRHGSPTAVQGAFFNESFSLFPGSNSYNIYENLTMALGSSGVGSPDSVGSSGLGSPTGSSGLGSSGFGSPPGPGPVGLGPNGLGSPNGFGSSSHGALTGLGSSGLGSPTGSSSTDHSLTDQELVQEGTMISLPELETPPVSPVESLAGDLDSMSISSPESTSPTPAGVNPCHDRLPIFAQLTEQEDIGINVVGVGAQNAVMA